MTFICEYLRTGVPRHSGKSRQRREGEMLREEVGRSQGQARRGTVAMVVPGKRGVGTVAYQPRPYTTKDFPTPSFLSEIDRGQLVVVSRPLSFSSM
jgi:hypothetical protein